MQFIDILKKLINFDKEQNETELLDAIATNSGLDEKTIQEAQELIKEIIHPHADLSLEQTLFPYAKLAYIFEKNGIPFDHAQKLAALFDTKGKKEVLDYLLAFAKANPKAELMHDACGFVLPQGTPEDIAKWKTLAITQPKGGEYPLLNSYFKKLLGLSNDIVDFIKKQSAKDKVKACQNNLMEEIRKAENQETEIKMEEQGNVFKSTSVFKISGKGKDAVLVTENITLPADVTKTTDNKMLKMGLAHLNSLIAAYAKLCDQYEANMGTLGELIGEKNYLHALAKRQELRAKRCEFHLGQPFKQLSIEQLFDYYEAYLQENPDPVRSYFTKMGIKEQKYKEFLKLNRTKGGIYIPDVLIDGVTVGYPGFYLKKINVNNENEAAIAATIGKLTRCCQSLSGEAGEPCVIHSLTSPYGGCYAIFKGDVGQAKGENVVRKTAEELSKSFQGGMWVWRSKNDAIVFDSIEMLNDQLELENIGIALVRQAAKELVEQSSVAAVLCGSESGISSKVGIGRSLITEEFRENYLGYSDASTQLVIRDKHRLFYLFGTDKEGTDIAIQWIKDKLSPPIQLMPLYEAIYWALSEKKDFLDIISKLSVENFAVQELIGISKEYYEKGISDNVIRYIKLNPFFLNALDCREQTPLMNAILQGDIKSALTFIELKANLEIKTGFGDTVLMLAIFNNQVEVCRALIEKLIQSNVNTQIYLDQENNANQTALSLALTLGNIEIVRMLIDANANVNQKFASGDTVLMYALHSPNVTVEMIKCLADAKVNLNVLDRREQTPLINAILQEDIKSALILIESEANLEIKTSFGDTVLMLAICNNLVEVCRALIAKLIQSNVNTQIYLDQKNNANQTALSLALTLGNIEIVKMLINANANVNQKFSLGETVLMSALSSPNVTIEMIKFLVDAKVNLDEKNDYGETALLRAVAHSNAEIINFLIQAHANVDAQDEVGQTALISAVQRDKVDIAMALIAAKANLELKDINGQTARMCAVENGLEKVVLAIDNRLQEIALENEAKNKALLFSNPLKITAAQPEEESVSIHRPRSDSK